MHKKKLVVSVLGSPFPKSSSERIANIITRSLSTENWETYVVDLSSIPSDALLMRSQSPSLNQAIDKVISSDLVIVASPTYRATYTGLLKAFFDQFPSESLASNFALPIQTGGSSEHSLSTEYGLTPMLRSLGALILSNSIYSWGDHWIDETSPSDDLKKMISKSLTEIGKLIEE